MSYFLLILLVIILFLFFSSVKIVKQQTAYTVETLGKFSRVILPGLNLVVPLIEMTAKKVNLATIALDIPILAITSDKVNIKIETTLIYKVIPTKVYQAAYSLDNPVNTIKALIDNSIRAFVATQTHEEVIRARDEMTHYLEANLTSKLESYGFAIESFQFRDINLPLEITEAMSRVVASKRLQEAAQNEAEANFIKQVREAEATKETRRLQGEGLAQERQAIINGLAESVKELQMATGVTSEGVMNMVLLNQYIDMLRGAGNTGGNKVVFLNPSPNTLSDISQQLMALMKNN